MKSARRRAREFALQALYQWQLNTDDAKVVAAEISSNPEFAQADAPHFNALFLGAVADAEAIRAIIHPHLDRSMNSLSPVEHAILLIGGYEFRACLEIPYKVIINECVELAKSFGGTDGFKYVNGVLDKMALDIRAVEIQAARTGKPTA
jgi:transcription antitermination protein NusB